MIHLENRQWIGRVLPISGSLLSRFRMACVVFIGLIAAGTVDAVELTFAEPEYLSGDDLIGPAAGMQMEADVALGGSTTLAVWSDFRSSPDDYPPFATEGSGADIYGARIDVEGNIVGSSIVINQALGDQVEPAVAWNGTHWIVVWRQETVSLPTYEELRAVRVGPDGTVLDDPPLVVHNNQSYYSGTVVEGGPNGDWLVLFQASGNTTGLRGVRIDASGTVLTPAGRLIHATDFLIDFDLAFAQDEYMIVWEGSFDAPRARRYAPDLTNLGTTAIPFGQRITTDGTDFLVGRASGAPPLATVDALFVSHSGVASPPFTLYTAGGQSGTCCVDVTWGGSNYWVAWGNTQLARVTPAGDVLDPDGFSISPSAGQIGAPRLTANPAGGIQLVYNNGVSGAADPKDVYVARVTEDAVFENETVISVGAPAQLSADFAEGDEIHAIAFLSRTSDEGRILLQRIDEFGTSLDPEPIEVASGQIPGEGIPTLGEPNVAWNGSNFIVTWSDGFSIFARRLLPDGTFLDPLPQVVMEGHDPDVAAVGSTYLVVGLDFLSDNPHWQATHSMRVDGTTGLNLDPEPNALGGFAIFARHPRVVSWGDRWLAVWQRNLSHDDTIAGTTAAIIESDGTTPGLIDVPLGWRPDVAVSDDTALFVGVTETIASATTDLDGVIMTADGTFPGAPFSISDASDKQLLPAVTWGGNEFVVVWEDKRNSEIYFDERTDLYAARVSEGGVVLDPDGIAVLVAVEPETKPALETIGTTTFLAASVLRTEAPHVAYRVGVLARNGDTTGIDEGTSATPVSSLLRNAYPNPTSGSTTISFRQEAGTPVTVRIFDVDGRLLRTLEKAPSLTAQEGHIFWDGRDGLGSRVNSGVYLYEFRTHTRTERRKIVLSR